LVQPTYLGALAAAAPELAQAFVTLSSDLALVLDAQGTVVSVAQDAGEHLAQLAQGWAGRPWIDTVTADTRGKIARLLGELQSTGHGRRREVNHAGGATGDIPVAYTALRLGSNGPALAVGRDLRQAARLQQRLLSAQQEIEDGFWLARQTEKHQRLLMHLATDAVLILAGETLRVVESNAPAALLLRSAAWTQTQPLSGSEAEHQFDAQSRPAVRRLLQCVQAGGRCPEVQVRLARSHLHVNLQALRLESSPTLRQPRLLLRARTAGRLMWDAFPLDQVLLRLVEGTCDAMVLADAQGCVVAANRAFQRMVLAPDEDSVRGRALSLWLSARAGTGTGTGTDTDTDTDTRTSAVQAILQSLPERGIVQGRWLTLRRPEQMALEVNVTATLLAERDQAGAGFILRAEPVPAREGS
jgi:transcriptional regulator PpsR